MFLYENNGEFIDVYKLEPKLEEIKNYKKKEMEMISSGERLWGAFATRDGKKILENDTDFINSRELGNVNYDHFDDCGHIFFTCSSASNKRILNLYYDTDCSFRFYKIDGDDDIKYILLFRNLYFPKNTGYDMNGIINVPESLYLLEVLLQGRFNLIGNKDVTEQLKLFDIQHYGRINTSVLKNICEYELLTDSYESIINRTNINKNVVSKVKKLAR